jgi:hypothetical protein
MKLATKLMASLIAIVSINAAAQVIESVSSCTSSMYFSRDKAAYPRQQAAYAAILDGVNGRNGIDKTRFDPDRKFAGINEKLKKQLDDFKPGYDKEIKDTPITSTAQWQGICQKWKTKMTELTSEIYKHKSAVDDAVNVAKAPPVAAPTPPVANNPSLGVIAAEATSVLSSSGCTVTLKIASMSPGQQITARWGAAANNPTVTIFANMNQTRTGAIDWTGAIPGMSSWDASNIILNTSTKSGGAINLAACKPAPAAAVNYVTVAVDGGSFTVTGTQVARYGKGNTWITKSVTGTVFCGPSTFDGRDPVPNVAKDCQILR